MEIKSHYYNYYGVKGRYNPQEKQKTSWEKLYTPITERIEGNNHNPENDVYKAYLKLEERYYTLGEANRAKYSNYEDLKQALSQKYFSVDSPFQKYTSEQRRAMYDNELSMSAFGYATNINDPLITDPVHAPSDEEQQDYNRKMVNSQLQNILSQNGIDLKGADIQFIISPNDYHLKIMGLDDENLKLKIENLLNQNDNSKELFFHILQSLRVWQFNFKEGVIEKYRATSEFARLTGLDLGTFHQDGVNFTDKNGQNALEIYKNALEDSSIPPEFRGFAYESFKNLLESFRELDFSKIPELNLQIGYKDGVLYDLEHSHIAKLDLNA
ncbi:DUF4885 family protein [Campylobacter cuniculorum]|uniref:Uncharacterized protein n=2 Tax=Campylobacter cuniculorum TaxID=374106 RepID=A0A1W6BXA1_9BACT|nr:DUF4885 family protein [Campylobacter cuniculorum]ARJ56711.1 hypothetical protein (DUF4885 domain) [Campylobacter cuniculorum DSM 23162 = LMG 24588]QOR04182.1 DUF4885 family protein [Campylobacter cuniculorum]